MAIQHEQIKGIVFDLDGTLIDSVPDLTAALNVVMAELKLPDVSPDLVLHWIGNGMEMLVTRALSHQGADTSVFNVQQAYQMCANAYAQLSGTYSVFFPGVRMVLKTLKQAGYPLAIVTNKPSRFLPHIIEDFGLEGVFDLVLGGDCVSACKPDPEPLFQISQHWQLQPEQLLMIGDSKNDIEAGKAAGTATLGLTYGYNYGEHIGLSQPDAVADTLLELLDLLTPAT